MLEYADGNCYHVIGLSFEVAAIGVVLQLSDETTEYGYFTQAQLVTMDVIERHHERIADAFAEGTETKIRCWPVHWRNCSVAPPA